MNRVFYVSQKGFIGTFLLVIVALLTLQFAFRIDILTILQSPPMLTISHTIIKYALIAWHGLVSLYQTITT